jgi:selenocysteine lyase/cysteine desulfurase
MLSSGFRPDGVYLDSATYGLPPQSALDALAAVTADWAAGRYDPPGCDHVVSRAREIFARLHGVSASDVAIGHQVSPFVGLIAGSLPRAARILTAEGDFTSLLFPFLAAGCELRMVALDDLPNAIGPGIDAVAVSAVQSADGRVANLPAIAAAAADAGALTVIDATQACGWLSLDASQFDAVVTGGYKWLCHPRGTAFLTTRPELRERVAPVLAGWYSTEHPWDTCYGTPLRLAGDARRFDVSPAWMCWHAALAALELLESIGIPHIQAHNVDLANRLRTGLGLPAGDSAIVSFALDAVAAGELARADIRTSTRAGRVRASCHLYNSEDDVDRLLDVVNGVRRAG